MLWQGEAAFLVRQVQRDDEAFAAAAQGGSDPAILGSNEGYVLA